MISGVRVIDRVRIPLGDGRRLAARLWLPAGQGPVPAILEYLPYRLADGTAARDATTHPVWAEAGFVGVRVDIAGSGDSDGLFDDEYSEREMRDGEAVLAWIAAQDWCDGRVGMIGISWGGFNGLQLAARRPPALRAVVTVCSSVDRFADDIHFMGGCLLTDNFNWGAQMTAYMTRPPDPEARGDWREVWLRRIEALPFLAADWLGHPRRDAYWRFGSVGDDLSRIEVPVLAIGGWADAYVNAPFALAEGLDVPVAALLGLWEHKYPHLSRIAPADFHGEVLRWFGRHLAGSETLPPPRLRVCVQEHGAPTPAYRARSGTWLASAARPSEAVTLSALPLAPGRLGETSAAEIDVTTSLGVGAAAAYFCPGMRLDHELAGDQAPDDDLSVSFDGAPLDRPLTVVGRPAVEIAFRVDRPVAQLCVRLCDVAPDGVSERVSYRAVSLNAHASFAAPEVLEPGRLYRMRVPLNACAHRWRAGHRVRLAMSTSYWPVVWPSPHTATVRLALSGCRLVLPEWRDSGVDPAPPGPPRRFPTLAAETLVPPQSTSRRWTEEDGTAVLATLDDFGLVRQGTDGRTTGHSVRQRFAIVPGDPLSARHEAWWRYEMGGAGWAVAIDSHACMTCDDDTFHLTRRVTARDGGQVVLDRDWKQGVPRQTL